MIKKYIRKKVQQVLKAANIKGVGQDVFCRRSFNASEEELPLILVYANQNIKEPFDSSPKSYKNMYEIVIEVMTAHDSDEELCDEMDDLEYEVEQAIENDPILRGWQPLHKDGQYLEETIAGGTQYDSQGNGSSPMGAVRMNFVSVFIEDPSNKKAIDDFLGVDIEWNIGDHGTNKAIDKVDII